MGTSVINSPWQHEPFVWLAHGNSVICLGIGGIKSEEQRLIPKTLKKTYYAAMSDALDQ